MEKNNSKETGEKQYILDDVEGTIQQSPTTPSLSITSSCDLKGLLDNEDERNEYLSPTLYASFNYINSIIGSGVIGIPLALQEAGFGAGLILLVIVALVTDYSLHLMIRCGHLAGCFSYQEIMNVAFGKKGYVLLTILQFAYPFIAMISYNVAVGDTVTKVLVRLLKLEPTSFFSQREVVVFMASAFITLPLCLYKDLAKLAKISLFSLVCVGFILLIVIAEFFMLYNVVPSTHDAWTFYNYKIIPAIGIMTFAFMCHHNTFLLYNSIKNASQEKWDHLTHISMTVSFLLTAAFGIVGYATFTGNSQGDLLENYCANDDLISAARIFFSISILLTYPFECFVTREIIERTIFSRFNDTNTLTDTQNFIVTFFLVLIAYLLSMATDCLGWVLELNGVIAAVPLAYILPAVCYFRLEPSPFLSKPKLFPLMLFLFGVIVAVFGIVFVFEANKTLGNCSHGATMDYCQPNLTVTTRDSAGLQPDEPPLLGDGTGRRKESPAWMRQA